MWSGLTARSMIHGGLASFPPAPPPPSPPLPQSLFRLGLNLNLVGSRSLAQQHASSAVPLPSTQLQCRMNPHRRLQEKGRLQRQFGLLTCCAVNEPRSSAMEEAEAGGRGGVAGDGWISDSEVNGPLLLRDQESGEGGGGGGGPMLETASAAVEAGASPSSRELWNARAEDGIERAIFNFRFLTLLAIGGSLAGSLLCFLKGCGYVFESFNVHRFATGQILLKLVEAVDVYLFGTVLLIFGMGVYGLFISNVATDTAACDDRALQNTSLFGLFLLKRRPKWMRIGSLDELKTKLGHVIVMILLVKMYEKSKVVVITSTVDLLGYAISIFMSSTSLYVLHRLHHG